MIIQVWAGRFKAEIGNFVTKRRSGFGQRAGGGKKKDAPDARQNVGT